jgi:hypothetical protein
MTKPRFVLAVFAAFALNAAVATAAPEDSSTAKDSPAPSISALSPGAEGRYKFAQQQVERFDKNKDGKVTVEEYLAPARESFKVADTNGDGNVTTEELADSFLKRNIRVPSPAPQNPLK